MNTYGQTTPNHTSADLHTTHEDYLHEQWLQTHTVKTYTCKIGLNSKYGCTGTKCEDCEHSHEEEILIDG